MTVVMVNDGTNAWPAGSTYKLSSQNPQDNTVFGIARVALAAPVSPGQNATFQFPAVAPTNAGTYNFQWRMIHEGVNVFGAVTPATAIDVLSGTNHATFVSQSVTNTMNPGLNYTVTVAMKNLSTNTWTTLGGYQLAAINPPDNLRWGANRVALNAPVPPGGVVTLSFIVTAPNLGGTYPFQWQMVQDGVGLFGQPSPVVNVTVLPPVNSAAFGSQNVPATMTAGLSYTVPITLTNTGSTLWTSGAGFALRSVNPVDNLIWSVNRIALPTSVSPGGTVTFNVPVVAPLTSGSYNFQWQMSQDGSGFFGAPTPNVAVSVIPLVSDAVFVRQVVPTLMGTGLTYTVSITMSNSGTSFWQPGDFQLASANPADNLIWSANRVALPATVAPGGTATFAFQVAAPMLTASYSFQWGMFKVGQGPFGTLSPPTTIAVGSQTNGAAFGSIAAPANVTAGLDYAVSVTVTNTGTTTWSTNDYFELVSQNPLTNQNWGVSRFPVPAVVVPGQTVIFSFVVTAPVPVGSYSFQWQMRQSVLGLFGLPSPNRVINVTAVGNASRFVSQTVTTNMIPGAHYPVVIRMRNIGTNTWSEVTRHRLGAINPAENGNWGSARQVLSTAVPPGAEGVFSFMATGPLTVGSYNFQWRSLQEGVGYFGDSTPNVVVAVADGLNNSGFVSQTMPATMNAGQTYPITITLTNTGTTTWTGGSLYFLASQNPPDNLTWGLNRVIMPTSVPPATAVTFGFNVTAPATPGTYNFQWRMIQAGLGLFGASTPNVAVVVSTPVAGNDAGFVAQNVPSPMFVGQNYQVSVTMTNSGGTTWAAGTYRLRSQNPVDGSIWGLSSIALNAPVAPGTAVTFNFNVTAPVTPGLANFQWQMSQDGTGFFGVVTPNVPVSVVIRANDAGFGGLNLPGSMTTGQVASASVTMTNLGTTTWTVGAYRLGSLNPTNGMTWGTNRIELPGSVAPGAGVTLTFPITAPATAGSYGFQWQMIEEATGYFGAVTPNVVVPVTQPTDGASFGSQSVAATMNVAQTYPVSVVMTNTGNTTWLPGSYRLGSQNPTNNATWGVTSASLLGAVAPGGIATFGFTVTPPVVPGNYNFQWQMWHDGVGYFGPLTPVVPVTVSIIQDNAGFVSQAVPLTMSAGLAYPITITMTNTGDSIWTSQGGYALASQNPLDNSVWSSNRIALPVSVAPGAAVTFNFIVFAPAVVGTYNFSWQMVQGASGGFGTVTPNVAVRVVSVGNAARFMTQNVPTNMLPGTRYSVAVVMRNTGTNTWSELAKYRLSVQNPQDNAFWGVRRAVLPANVAPGQDGVFVFNVTAPAVQTQYPFQWRMLVENIAYFGDFTPNLLVNVTNSFDSAGVLAQSVPGTMSAGQSYPVSVVLTNDGTTTWSAGANYRLVAQSPPGSTNWGIVQVGLPGNVARSNTVTLAFNVTAPANPGSYNFQWQMMRGAAVFGATTPLVAVKVVGNTDASGFVTQSVPGIMTAGQTYPVSVSLTNTGNTTWTAGANYRLVAQNFPGNTVWGSSDVPLPASVPPGGSVSFNFSAVAPVTPGSYNWQWQMQHGATYFGALTPLVPVNVVPLVDDAILGVPAVASALNVGLTYPVTLRATNTGTTTWDPSLGYALVSQNPQSNTIWGVSRVALPSVVAPGQSVTLSFSIRAPTNIGGYDFQWQMVREGTGVFGAATENRAIVVSLRGNDARFVFQSVPTEMIPGLSYPVTVRMLNAGTNVWSRLTSHKLASQNPLSNTNWGFVRITLPVDVLPGAEAVFQFAVTAPTLPGTYDFQTQMIQDAVEIFGDRSPNLSIVVRDRGNAARFVSQDVPASVLAGQTYSVVVRWLNVGTNAWSLPGGYSLTAQNPPGSTNWGIIRVGVVEPVLPGAVGVFTFNVGAPVAPGAYDFQWQMGQSGVELFGDLTPNRSIAVVAIGNSARFVSQVVPTTMLPTFSYPATVRMQNIGTNTWGAGANYRLVSANPTSNAVWTVASVVPTTDVLPGAEAVFDFTVTAPAVVGDYGFQWQMSQDGVGAFGSLTVNQTVTVQARGNSARFVAQTVPSNMVPGLTYPVTLRYFNAGTNTWNLAGLPNYSLASQNPLSNLRWGPGRIPLAGDIAPGTEAVFNFNVTAPAAAGIYNFQYRMINDGVELFGDQSPNLAIRVEVPTNDAVLAAQSVATTMLLGQTYPVLVAFTNSGNTTWTEADGYAAVALSPAENSNWGTNRLTLAAPVPPGGVASFAFNVVAPGAPAVLNFQWQMAQTGAIFGTVSPLVAVSVEAPLNAAAFVGQVFPLTIRTGLTAVASLQFRNIGNLPWTPARGYYLQSLSPTDNVFWGTNRIALAAPVPPGQTGTFSFNVTAPLVVGSRDFQWGMALDGSGGFGEASSDLLVNLTAPVDDALFVTQTIAAVMITGQTYNASIRLRNTGDTTWTTAAGYALAAVNPVDNTTWGTNRAPLSADTLPGQEAVFEFVVTAPVSIGLNNFQWQMVKAGSGVFGAASDTVVVSVRALVSDSEFVAQVVPASMLTGRSYNALVSFKNTGETTWDNATGFRLAAVNPGFDSTWGTNRLMLAAPVVPGQTGVFALTFSAPPAAGPYDFRWRMIQEGRGLFGAGGANVTVTVTAPVNNAAFVTQTVASVMLTGQTYNVSIRMRNTGDTTWATAAGYALAAVNPLDNTTWGGNRAPLAADTLPGQEVVFNFVTTAPLVGSLYNFQWQMVRAGSGVFGTASDSVAVTVRAPRSDAEFVSQSVPANMLTGRPYSASISFRNTGETTWDNTTGFRLAAVNPGFNLTWGTNRLALPAPVVPGQTGVFALSFNAPLAAGPYDFRWQMMQEGSGLFGAVSTNVSVLVTPPVNNALFVTQAVASVMITGQTYNVSIRMRNTGDTAWTTAAGYSLAAVNPVDNTTWGGNRAVLPADTAPGQEVGFNFVAVAPSAPSIYNFQWQMVKAGGGIFGAASDNVAITVRSPLSQAAFVSQTVPTNLATGQTFNVSVVVRNTGDTVWPAGGVFQLAARNPADNLIFGTNRVALTSTVAPGSLATFGFVLRAPATVGSYNHQWQMVQEGVGGFGDLTPNVAISVGGTIDSAIFVSQSVPASMVGAQRYPVAVTMRNTGTTTWEAATKYKLSAQNPVDNRNWGDYRILLAAPVPPGGSVTFSWTATAPSPAGNYNFQWRMLREGVGWFGQSSANLVIPVSTAPNDAAYVSQVVPLTMRAGTTNNVTVTMRNTGTRTWTALESYRLGSQSPADNATWGLRRVALPANVAPGANAVFTFPVKAPSTTGSYVFGWKMIQEGVTWFGTISPNTTITVGP